VTTVILLATLTFFFLPHTVYFFISLNTDTSQHQSMSPVASFLLVLYMTLLPYLKMISDPLVYGVRMCRRSSPGVPGTSRVIVVDAASTAAAVTRGGPARMSAVLSTAASSDECCRWCLRFHRRRRSVNNPDTYTAVVSSVPHVGGPQTWRGSSARERPSVYNAIRLQTIPPSTGAQDDIEEIL